MKATVFMDLQDLMPLLGTCLDRDCSGSPNPKPSTLKTDNHSRDEREKAASAIQTEELCHRTPPIWDQNRAKQPPQSSAHCCRPAFRVSVAQGAGCSVPQILLLVSRTFRNNKPSNTYL